MGVETVRPRLQLLAFTLALALLAWPTIVYFSESNGAAAIMGAMCLAGLVAGRVVGIPGTVLLPVAFGLMMVLWMVWSDIPGTPRVASALAHGTGGVLLGWGLVMGLRQRIRDPLALSLLGLSVVFVITLAWEVGEYTTDRLLDTALRVNRRDSADDILFGTVGGLLGIALAGAASFRRRSVTRR